MTRSTRGMTAADFRRIALGFEGAQEGSHMGAASIIIALLYVAMPGLAIGTGTIVSSLIILLTHVRHRSTALDLSIVSDTAKVILFGTGAK